MIDGPAMYAFCGGDPVNARDPMGTEWIIKSSGVWEWVPKAGEPETAAEEIGEGKAMLRGGVPYPNGAKDGQSYFVTPRILVRDEGAEALYWIGVYKALSTEAQPTPNIWTGKKYSEWTIDDKMQMFGVAGQMADEGVRRTIETTLIEAPQLAAGGLTKVPGIIGGLSKVITVGSGAKNVYQGVKDISENGVGVLNALQTLGGLLQLKSVLAPEPSVNEINRARSSSRFSGGSGPNPSIGPVPLQFTNALQEAATAAKIQDISKLVDEVRYVAGSSSFKVLNGQRILSISSKLVGKDPASILLELGHEVVHAEQFAILTKNMGGNAAKAEKMFMAAQRTDAAYMLGEIHAERIARMRTSKYLGGLPTATLEDSRKYLEYWENKYQSWVKNHGP